MKRSLHLIFLLALGALTLSLSINDLPSQTLQENLWVTNGTVRASVRSGNTVYIGGEFNEVGPATGSCVKINSNTGIRDADFPKVNSRVFAIASDGVGGWYIGGDFTKVGDVARKYLAHVRADNSVDPDWVPEPNSSVKSLVLSGSYLYAAGYFTVIGGQARAYFAMVDLITGAATSWNPGPNGTVYSLATNATGTILYIGGSFTTISATTRNRIAAYNIPAGSLTGWNPNATSGSVVSLAVSGSVIYAGGYFSNIGGQARNNLAALDATTGNATTWNPNVNGTVYTVAISGNWVYAGGSFSMVGGSSVSYITKLHKSYNGPYYFNAYPNGNVYTLVASGGRLYVGGAFTSIGGESRRRVAVVDLDYGYPLSWNPGLNYDVWTLAVSGTSTSVCIGGYFTSMGSVTRNGVAALDAFTGEVKSWNAQLNGNVQCLAIADSKVFFGGEFSNVGGESRNNIAAVDATTGSALDWNPNADYVVSTILVSGSVLYAGGEFSTVGGLTREFFAAIDATTGAPTSWVPTFDGPVRSLAISGTSLYVAGEFVEVNTTQTRQFLASFDVTNGSLRSWNPIADGPVYALATSGTAVYAGGEFNSIGDEPRPSICAIDGNTGDVTTWNPVADGPVWSLAVSGSTIYAGGEFNSIGGQTRLGIASLSATSNTASSWNPNSGSDWASIFSISVYGQTVYLGGEYQSMAGSVRSNFAAVTDTSMTFGGENAKKYRTFMPDTLQLNVYQKPSARPKYPNTANVIQETYKKNPTTLIIVGKANQTNDAGKIRGYVQPKAYGDVLKSFYKSGVVHTGIARGLDLDKKGVVLVKRFMSLDATKHDNKLLANLLALQVNIAASDTGVTPNGLADLVYDEGNENPLSGMTIDEIATYANNLMTNWEHKDLSVYENIDTTVRKINAAFSGNFDTTSWITGSKLVVKGAVSLGKISFLHSSTSFFSHRVIPVASFEDMTPSKYLLQQNYPNPFNPTTTIQFELAQNSLVTLKVYNMVGQEVATVLDREEMYEGEREVVFRANELASGVYFYRLIAEGILDDGVAQEPYVLVKKMMLLK